MGRPRKSKLPDGMCELPFADCRNLIEHLEFFRNDQFFAPRHIPEPTEAEPGSKAKIGVLAQRIIDGQDLWHEDDPQIDLETMASFSRFFDPPETDDEEWDDD